MKLFDKSKIKNQFLLKHGAYTAVIIAVVLVAVIAVNLLSTVIADRFPTSIDLSASDSNSISAENREYIKDVEKKINIVVCASEEGFVGQYMQAYALQNYQTQVTPEFLTQTQNLLALYPRYNDKITVSYSDPDKASFNSVQQIVPNTTLYYGDILVYCTFKGEDGEETQNARVITFGDMYELGDDTGGASYGYGYYSIASSKVETAVTSAIYSAQSEKSNTVALLSGHSKQDAFDGIWANLTLNNYNVVEVKDTILTEKAIPADADIIAIAAPKKDFTADEIKVLEKFLDNGGERGKNLMVFCDGTKTGYTNLYTFLKDWGAELEEGKLVYETDESNMLYYPTYTWLANAKSDFTASINKQTYSYIAGDMVPMKTAYTTLGNRVATALVSTSDSVVAAPMDIDITSWEPSKDYKKQSFAAVIYTHDTVYEENGGKSSGVLVCSSVDFISKDWNSYNDVGNNKSIISLLNNVCGRDTTEIYFDQKTVDNRTFLAPSVATVKVVRWIFVIILPIATLAAGIFIWIRRSRR